MRHASLLATTRIALSLSTSSPSQQQAHTAKEEVLKRLPVMWKLPLRNTDKERLVELLFLSMQQQQQQQ